MADTTLTDKANGMIRGLHHVALNTRNFEKMVDFYRNGFGFGIAVGEWAWDKAEWIYKTTGYRSVARQVILKTENCYLEIFEYKEPEARESGGALRPFDHGFTHIAFEVGDIHDEYRRLTGMGMPFAYCEPVPTGDQADVWAVYGKDPDGNIIEILQVPIDHDTSLGQLCRT